MTERSSRFAVALLSGITLPALFAQLLWPPFGMFVVFLQLPGIVAASPFEDANHVFRPGLVFVFNVVVYSLLAFAVVFQKSRAVPSSTFGRTMIAMTLVAIAAILVPLYFSPKFNPMWPRGMDELAKQEAELRGAFPLDMSVDSARKMFLEKGIEFQERAVKERETVTTLGLEPLVAEVNDWIMLVRFKTDASNFICGYDMNLDLVFGPDRKLKRRFIGRQPMCP